MTARETEGQMPLGDPRGGSELEAARIRAELRARMFGVASDPPRLGTYRLLRRLGAGGMGVVYEAIDERSGERVAVKTLRGVDPQGFYRLKQEFRALSDLTHDNLVHLRELAIVDGIAFIVMELIDGRPFLEWVREPGADGVSSCDVSRLRAGLRQLAAAVLALHRSGKLHLDIKPSNVLVTERGQVVLLDFGLVREQTHDPLTSTSELVVAGTPAYMAPEQALGGTLGPSADMYAIGVMAFEALTGALPSAVRSGEITVRNRGADGPRPVVVGTVHPDLDRLCAALLDRDPMERPGAEQLLAVLGGPGEAADEPAAEASVAPALFVGRERELDQLGRALERSREGRLVVVHVRGPSGIGKSALVRQFLETARKRDRAVILRGRCYEREAVPYKAFDGMVDALSRYLNRLPAVEAAALMPREIQALARVFPVLGRVPAVASAPLPAGAPLDGPELRRRAFSALKEILARVADRRPLILHVDDLQWGDIDSAWMMRALQRDHEPPAMLFVASYRAEDLELSPALRTLLRPADDADRVELATLEVEPLSASDGQRLAAHFLTPERSHLAAATAAEAGGNPLFVVELAQHAATAAGDDDAPLSLDVVVRRRVAALPETAREILEVAVVAGTPVQRGLTARAIGRATLPHTIVGQLRAVHLVRTHGPRDEDTLEPYHDRVREAVHAGLAPERTLELHRRIAEALEHTPGADPAEIAAHWARAAEPTRAATFAAAAAERARSALAFQREADLYRIVLASPALTASERSDNLVRLGHALVDAYRGAEAADAFLAAVPDVSPTTALELKRVAAECLLRSGHLDRGLEIMVEVVTGAGMSMPRSGRGYGALALERARLLLAGLAPRARTSEHATETLRLQVDVCWSAGTGLALSDPLTGFTFQLRQLRIALRSGDPRRLARALGMYGAHLSTRGTLMRRRVAAITARLRELATETEDPLVTGLLTFVEGAQAYHRGDWRSAVVGCDQAARLFAEECRGAAWETTLARVHAESALSWLGEIAELRDRVRRHAVEARDRGDLVADVSRRASGLGALGWLADDDPDRAQRELEDTLATWTARGLHLQHFWAGQSRAMIDLYRGDIAECWKRMSEATSRESVVQRIPIMRISAWALRSSCALGAAALATDPTPMLDVARRLARSFRKQRLVFCDAFADMVEGSVCWLTDRRPAALSLLERSAGGFATANMALHAAAVTRRIGELAGGDDGRTRIEEGERGLRAQGVKNPARLAAVLTSDLVARR